MVWGEGFTGWLRQNQPEHLRLGRLGERAAKRHLKQAGLKFLYANFKGEQGEIDLVFREGKVLVFVEVKARSSESWARPAAAVNAAKQRRIVATAREYVRMLPEGGVPISFDIVELFSAQHIFKYIKTVFGIRRSNLLSQRAGFSESQ